MIFVFGSNEKGIHGGGAARVAAEKHGAVHHQGFGPQGDSFAIPTCSRPTGQADSHIPYERLKFYVDSFLLYAKSHPELEFQVTKVGCGLAGWTNEQVAPLFKDAPENCFFDTEWEPFLAEAHKFRFWGSVDGPTRADLISVSVADASIADPNSDGSNLNEALGDEADRLADEELAGVERNRQNERSR